MTMETGSPRAYLSIGTSVRHTGWCVMLAVGETSLDFRRVQGLQYM